VFRHFLGVIKVAVSNSARASQSASNCGQFVIRKFAYWRYFCLIQAEFVRTINLCFLTMGLLFSENNYLVSILRGSGRLSRYQRENS